MGSGSGLEELGGRRPEGRRRQASGRRAGRVWDVGASGRIGAVVAGSAMPAFGVAGCGRVEAPVRFAWLIASGSPTWLA